MNINEVDLITIGSDIDSVLLHRSHLFSKIFQVILLKKIKKKHPGKSK